MRGAPLFCVALHQRCVGVLVCDGLWCIVVWRGPPTRGLPAVRSASGTTFKGYDAIRCEIAIMLFLAS